MKVLVLVFALFSAFVASATTVTFTTKAEMCEAAKTQCMKEKPKAVQKKHIVKPSATDPLPGRVITVAGNGDLKAEGKTTPGTVVFLVDGPSTPEMKIVDLRTRQTSSQPLLPSVAAGAVAATLKNKTFWGWVHPESSSTSKYPCYTDRAIQGVPPQCSEIKVEPSKEGETEDVWRTRMAALTGIKVGIGGITGTANSDVKVK